MLRTVVAIAALALSAGTALADDYTCRSIAGGLTLGFTLTQGDAGYAVTDAALKIGDDPGYSTSATEPASLATITGLDMDNKVLFNFHATASDTDIATVRLVTRFEGGGGLATGTLKPATGGVYAIRCDIAHEG
ncbi:hypothetical protein VW23_002180 [Devosia insulae DS-56]|uniref:Uncharacterized protein n=1 Tax=Devosia insulae DS-56 TaxID=1116389 RepID=A0A1E5XL38_9HYPH|nr:hypothetical protein [Devosia insulae]OEO29320.1 hypothetical protein VW23_002180 [Devosia insulae DS-56]